MTDRQSPEITRRRALAGFGAAGLGAAAAALSTTKAAAATNEAKPLAGKVAVVTGARANMGRAFSIALGGMGADVVVHYHRAETVAQAQETARLVEKAGARTALVQGDLGDPATARAIFDAAQERFGGVDIVVNNAGAIIKKPLAEFTDAEFDRLDRVNNRGLFHMLREAARRVRPGGRIINNATSLLAGAAPGYAIYSGTKAPAEEYSRMLAKELGEKRVTVNSFAPGPIDTPFFHGQENERSVAYASRLAAEKRLGEIADITPVVAFLASPESQWVNGQTLFVNGGYITR